MDTSIKFAMLKNVKKTYSESSFLNVGNVFILATILHLIYWFYKLVFKISVQKFIQIEKAKICSHLIGSKDILPVLITSYADEVDVCCIIIGNVVSSHRIVKILFIVWTQILQTRFVFCQIVRICQIGDCHSGFFWNWRSRAEDVSIGATRDLSELAPELRIVSLPVCARFTVDSVDDVPLSVEGSKNSFYKIYLT